MKTINQLSPLCSKQGFTLVEILIAIVLLSFLMIGVYTVTDNSTTTVERVGREDADFAQVGTVINRMEMDFSQFYTPLYFDRPKEQKKDPQNPYAQVNLSHNKQFPLITEDGHPVPLIEQPDKNQLIFFTSANRKRVPDSKESNYAWIYYSLRSMPDNKEDDEDSQRKGQYQLIRKIIATNPYTDDLNWDKVRAQPLLDYVKSFKIEFWSKKKKKFVESLSDLTNKYVIHAFRITIVRFDANNLEDTIERIFIPLWPYFDTTKDIKKDKTPFPTKAEGGDD